jgi:hypothetical protein
MLIASDLRLALDASIIGDRVGLTLDPWQAELLRNRPKRSLLLCSRQSGKSTVCALTALHTAIYSPGSLTIIASPSQRQSAEMFRTVMGFRAKLDVPLAAESVLRAEFKNGSRIVAYIVFRDQGQWHIKSNGMHYGPYATQRDAIRAAVDAAHEAGPKGP